MVTKDSIGRKIREFRKENELTVAQVARSVGRAERTVVSWEQGYASPNPEILVKLCQLFGVRISDFYDEDEVSERYCADNDEFRLVLYYRDLNDIGKARLTEYADALSSSEKFVQKGGDDSGIRAS